MQGHGRTADVPRDFTYENLADDVAALLNYLNIPRADLIGCSMGGAVAMECAIRHPDKVRRAVIISSTFRRDGMIAEALEAIPKLTADAFKGSPIEAEYKKLSPTPDDFPNFVQRIVATASKGYDFGADTRRGVMAKVIGNAVPPLLMVDLGASLVPALLPAQESKPTSKSPVTEAPARGRTPSRVAVR